MKKIFLILLVIILGSYVLYAKEKDKKEEHECCDIKDAFKVYACPMDEHKNTAFANKGDCPLCGMKLKEKVVCDVYVCPMEEHQDEMYLEKGKCPRCKMELIEKKQAPEKAKKFTPKKLKK